VSFTDVHQKDKYVVLDDKTRDTVWWNREKGKVSDKQPIQLKSGDHCKKIFLARQLSGKRAFRNRLFLRGK